MSLIVKELISKRDIKIFAKFPSKLYQNNPYYVPPIIKDEITTFSKSRNPAFETSDAKLFAAYKDGKMVGRIVGILNNPANEKWKTKNIRFSWIETIDDIDVVRTLTDAVINWGKELGMETITGPHGFCDMDPQGLLIEGFDKLATIASFYNHPYYKTLLEECGFEKDVDFVEFWSTTPYKEGIPGKLIRTSEWIKKRYNFKLVKYDSVKKIKERGRELFKLIEESFEENYGTIPLTEKQIDFYIKQYLPYINKDFLKIVDNEKGEMIGFLISMPNLSKAHQKSKGKLYPFGFLHFLKALKTYEVLDFYFAGVKKEYRGKGVDVIMAVDVTQTAMKYGFLNAESNQELEANSKIQAQWKFFNPVLHKKRRVYKKNIS